MAYLVTGESGTTKKVKQVIADRLEIDLKLVVEGASFESLGADSLDLVDLAMYLEDELGIEIPDKDMEKVTTIGDALVLVEDLTKGRD